MAKMRITKGGGAAGAALEETEMKRKSHVGQTSLLSIGDCTSLLF